MFRQEQDLVMVSTNEKSQKRSGNFLKTVLVCIFALYILNQKWNVTKFILSTKHLTQESNVKRGASTRSSLLFLKLAVTKPVNKEAYFLQMFGFIHLLRTSMKWKPQHHRTLCSRALQPIKSLYHHFLKFSGCQYKDFCLLSTGTTSFNIPFTLTSCALPSLSRPAY